MTKAILLLHERIVVDETVFAEIKIWKVPRAVRGSVHTFKYSLALVAGGACVLRYDNEAGKGDHRHDTDGREFSYPFRNAETLVEDVWKSVDAWIADRSGEMT